AGRTCGSALTAAGADAGIDRYVVSGRRDGPGRAEIETAPAAHDLRAGVRAQLLGKSDVTRLVEAADEVACLEDRAQHRSRIARIGAQITVAQIVRREQRSAAGQINDQIAMRDGSLLRRAERQCAARGWRGR